MNHENKIAIDFIDPLFAVVLNVSFAQIYTQGWFLDVGLIFHDPNNFYVVTLILGYLTVILSWIGYHRSIKTRWISVQSVPGRWRFALDVLLLISYFVLLVSYENFRRELWLLAIIFLLFIVWDVFKCLEWPDGKESDIDKRRDSIGRRGVTVIWFLFFLLLAIFHKIHPPATLHSCEDWIILLAAILGTYLYRLHKEKLWWKGLLLRLAFSRTDV